MSKKLPQRAKNLEYIDVPFEVKQLPDEADPKIFKFEGMASTFGNIDLVDDIIMPGAFQESLMKQTPVILWQHDRWEPIGMPSEIKETPQGLFMVGDLPRADTFVSGRVIPQMEIGSIKTMSIGFRIKESNMDNDTGIRTIIKLDLHEVSLVTFAANPLAMIEGFKALHLDDNEKKEFLSEVVKALGGNLKPYTIDDVKGLTQRDFEKVLRESGLFSKEAAVVMASQTKNSGEPSPKMELSDIKFNIEKANRASRIREITKTLEK